MTNRRRLAEVLRSICAELVAVDAEDSGFGDAAEVAESFLRKLKGMHRRVRVVAGSLEEEIRREGNEVHYGDMIEFSPLSGKANPVAPPMRIFKENEETLVAYVTFSAAFEGGPGLVHGGYVAAAFDELLGLTQSLTGKAGMTAILKVRYLRPCPLHTELRMEGKVEKVEGRRIVARGILRAGTDLAADAEATFVILEHEEFLEKVLHRS